MQSARDIETEIIHRFMTHFIRISLLTAAISMVTPGIYAAPDTGIYECVEVQPEFHGGNKELFKWLNANIKYPVSAMENGTQGKVVVKFTIKKDGTVEDPVVVRSVDPALDAEAVRVVKSMPKWKPALLKGEAVDCHYTLPVNFRLQNR